MVEIIIFFVGLALGLVLGMAWMHLSMQPELLGLKAQLAFVRSKLEAEYKGGSDAERRRAH